MKTAKQPPPSVASFAAPVTAYRYRCSGCGKDDVSVWHKAGVEHWRAFDVTDTYRVPDWVCGKSVLVAVVQAEAHARELPVPHSGLPCSRSAAYPTPQET